MKLIYQMRRAVILLTCLSCLAPDFVSASCAALTSTNRILRESFRQHRFLRFPADLSYLGENRGEIREFVAKMSAQTKSLVLALAPEATLRGQLPHLKDIVVDADGIRGDWVFDRYREEALEHFLRDSLKRFREIFNNPNLSYYNAKLIVQEPMLGSPVHCDHGIIRYRGFLELGIEGVGTGVRYGAGNEIQNRWGDWLLMGYDTEHWRSDFPKNAPEGAERVYLFIELWDPVRDRTAFEQIREKAKIRKLTSREGIDAIYDYP